MRSPSLTRSSLDASAWKYLSRSIVEWRIATDNDTHRQVSRGDMILGSWTHCSTKRSWWSNNPFWGSLPLRGKHVGWSRYLAFENAVGVSTVTAWEILCNGLPRYRPHMLRRYVRYISLHVLLVETDWSVANAPQKATLRPRASSTVIVPASTYAFVLTCKPKSTARRMAMPRGS